MKFALGILLALQIAPAMLCWGGVNPASAQPAPQAKADDDASLPGRRFAISNGQYAMVLLDTVTGNTWRLIVTTAQTSTCKGQRPPQLAKECEVWGWEPLAVFK